MLICFSRHPFSFFLTFCPLCLPVCVYIFSHAFQNLSTVYRFDRQEGTSTCESHLVPLFVLRSLSPNIARSEIIHGNLDINKNIKGRARAVNEKEGKCPRRSMFWKWNTHFPSHWLLEFQDPLVVCRWIIRENSHLGFSSILSCSSTTECSNI